MNPETKRKLEALCERWKQESESDMKRAKVERNAGDHELANAFSDSGHLTHNHAISIQRILDGID